MANPHGTSVCPLPLRIPNLWCSCPNRCEATRVCLGCYRHYCVTCFQEHRRRISTRLGHIIHESDLVLQAIRSTLVNDQQHRIFDPVQLRKEIDDNHDKLINEVKHTTRRALQSLRGFMDERSDELIDRLNPITVSHLNTWKEFKSYIETHIDRFREELRAANDALEEESTTSILVNIDRTRDIDWGYIIELQQVRQIGRRREQPVGIIDKPHFEHLTKGHKPFKTIEDQGVGNAIGASDHLVIFARGGNELCIVEPHANYRIIIPLLDDMDSAERSINIVDLCWSSTMNVFIVLTENQLFTLSPNRKIPTLIAHVQPPGKRLFCSCTCSGDKFLLCYTETGSSMEEWCTSDWKRGRSWDSPASCEENRKILCMRYTPSGALIGVTLSATPKAARFEVRDSQTLSCVWSREVPAPSCIGVLPFTDTVWLIGVFNYHKMFLLDKNKNDVQEIIMANPSKSTLRGIALVDQGTVVVRTAKTVIFFDLFH